MTAPTGPDGQDELRRQAAVAAVAWIESGMRLGLGSGRTALHAVHALADRLRSGALREVTGVPTSRETEAAARALGIPLLEGDGLIDLDLAIDGADEVDPALDLIKGAGGALFREKIVAEASRRVVIVIDEGKLVTGLGERRPLPIEVLPFGWRAHQRWLASQGFRTRRRCDSVGNPVMTEQGNFLLDCETGPIADPAALAESLEGRSGIVAHGLFLGLATDVLVGTAGGPVVHRRR